MCSGESSSIHFFNAVKAALVKSSTLYWEIGPVYSCSAEPSRSVWRKLGTTSWVELAPAVWKTKRSVMNKPSTCSGSAASTFYPRSIPITTFKSHWGFAEPVLSFAGVLKLSEKWVATVGAALLHRSLGGIPPFMGKLLPAWSSALLLSSPLFSIQLLFRLSGIFFSLFCSPFLPYVIPCSLTRHQKRFSSLLWICSCIRHPGCL